MIELDNVSLHLGAKKLDGLRLSIAVNQYAVLMGRTGSGKTSILEAICGLRHVHSGRVLLNNEDVTAWPPARRQIGYVPQDMALFTAMSVRDNLAYALSLRRVAPETAQARIEQLATLLGIDPLLDRMPRGLSGGESRRVALGRALAFQPLVLLLDEPLTGLDEQTRDSLCDLLNEVRSSTGVTVLHVTHNQADVDRLADVRLELIDNQIATGNA